MNAKAKIQYNEYSSVSLSEIIEEHITYFFDLHQHVLPPDGLYHRILSEVEKPLIEVTLKRLNLNQLQAARLLGINRNTLRKKIKDLHISLERLQQNR